MNLNQIIKKILLTLSLALIGLSGYNYSLFAQELPVDKYGRPDWVTMVEKKMISPKVGLSEDAEDEIDETVIFFESKSTQYEDVLFNHSTHTYWLSCSNCHETKGGAIFEQGAGANPVLMKDMRSGKKWCGKCHSVVAFPLTDCDRCHNIKKGTKPNEDWSIRESEE